MPLILCISTLYPVFSSAGLCFALFAVEILTKQMHVQRMNALIVFLA